MDLTYYTFALYVFLLICGLIWFNARLKRGGKKQDTGSYEKEQHLFKLYQNVEDMLNSFEEYAEDAKSEIRQSLEELNALLKEAKAAPADDPPKPVKAKAPAKAAKSPAAAEPDMSVEQKVPLLIKNGMDKQEVARALGISTREVSLIMDLKKL